MTFDIDQLNRMNPAYLGAYGLTTAPFAPQHDDRFYYLSNELKEQLSLLRHYCQYGDLLLMITGERGIGKSSLKQRFIDSVQSECTTCEIQAHTMMDASLLLRHICIGFGITEPPLDAAGIHQVLDNQLEHLNQKNSIPVLIIDDAHELPQDALQSLLYLAEHHSDSENAVRIILFCEPQIETMLEDPAIHSLKDRITHSMELSRFDEAQTAEYLKHRLAVAGLDGATPFTPKLVNKIHKASHGLPAEINNYAHQNLLDDSEPFVPDEDDHFDEDQPIPISAYTPRNIALGAIALIVVSVGLFFQDKINQLFEEPDTDPELAITRSTVTVVPDEQIKKPAFDNRLGTIEKPEAPVKEQTIEIAINTDKQAQDKKTMPEEKSESIIEQLPPNTGQETKISAEPALLLTAINPDPVIGSSQRQIISVIGKGFNKRQHVTVTWKDNKKQLPPAQVNVTSDTFMNLMLTVGKQPDTWTVTVTDPLHNTQSNTIEFKVTSADKPDKQQAVATQSGPTKQPAPAISKQTLHGEVWIRQQNKNHFTLQLIGTHQQQAPQNFLKQHKLKGAAAVFKSTRNGKNWYTLIYGNFANKTLAQREMNAMPKTIKPWLRSFASVQSSLRKETTAVVVSPTPAVTSLPKDITDQTGWLWGQDPRHYTLQLTAGKNEAAIKQFIAKHKLKGKAVYFHRLRDGQNWYILLYGSYPDQTAAKAAISKLPTTLRQAKPWARSFAAIHGELN